VCVLNYLCVCQNYLCLMSELSMCVCVSELSTVDVRIIYVCVLQLSDKSMLLVLKIYV
jgi:hypothetical protein